MKLVKGNNIVVIDLLCSQIASLVNNRQRIKYVDDIQAALHQYMQNGWRLMTS